MMNDELDIPSPPPTNDPHHHYTYGLLRTVITEQRNISKTLSGMDRRLEPLEEAHQQQKGAWKLLAWVGTMGGVIGGALTWLAHGGWRQPGGHP